MLFQVFFDKDEMLNKNIKNVSFVHVINQEKDTSH